MREGEEEFVKHLRAASVLKMDNEYDLWRGRLHQGRMTLKEFLQTYKGNERREFKLIPV